MPPKKEGGKGGGSKSLEALACVNAFMSTYKAASRRYGVAPMKQILELLEESIAGGGEKISKISLQGPEVGWQQLAAILDGLAGYPGVKNLCLWSCNIGDEGLVKLAQFIKSSGADKWWRGSKLKHVEICRDGSKLSPGQWPERYMSHVNGELPTLGKSFQLPSLFMGQADAVTPDTLKLADEVEVSDRPHYWKGERRWLELGKLLQPVSPGPQPAEEPGQGDGEVEVQEEVVKACEDEEDKEAAEDPIAKALEVARLNEEQGSLSRMLKPKSDATEALHKRLADRFVPIGFPGTGSVTSLVYDKYERQRHEVLEQQHMMRMQLGLPPVLGAPQDPSRKSTRVGTTGISEPGFSSLPSFEQQMPLSWSPLSMKQLSLGLSVLGMGIQVLSLDHNHLGDVGVRILAMGIKRCTTLKQLSLEDCGIGPAGAAALGEAFKPDPTPELAALQPNSLLALNLSRNPLSGEGLGALCEGLGTGLPCLIILNLAATGLTEDHVPALKALCQVFQLRPSIEQIDLDANFIGDSGASVFIPMLSAAKHIRQFRLSPRGLSKPVGHTIMEILKGNNPKKKRVLKKKKA